MPAPRQNNLSRRERQIMDVIYSRGQATAFEVIENIPDPPSYSAIRALLVILEKKGYVKHTKDGLRYVYSPTRPVQKEAQSAMKRMLKIFFQNSTEKALAALLDASDAKISNKELDRLSEVIKQARKEDKK